MNTLVLDIYDNDIEDILKKAADILIGGGTVAFPTETVYGLGANALSEEAIKKIYKAKGRPSDNPLIIHISDMDHLNRLTDDVSKVSRKLIEAFWPGPLTIIFKKKSNVPDIVTAGLDTVAVRMPKNEIALELIKKANIPVAAPSANLSGKPSPTRAEHVIEDLIGKVDAIIKGEDCSVGIESTVIDTISTPPIILRPGGISKEQIEDVIGQVLVNTSIDHKDEQVPKAPGMKYTHYAPKAPVIVFEGNLKKIVNEINAYKLKKEKNGLKVGIMACDETAHLYSGCVYSVGSREKIDSVANNLFHTLRCFDKEDIDIILSESFTTKGVGLAVMNRIIKSAGYNVVDVGGEE